MRQLIKFTVYGSTMEQINQNALQEWREYVEDSNAVLPRDTEIRVTPGTTDNSYVGEVLISARTDK